MPIFEVKSTVLVNGFRLTRSDCTIRSEFHNLGGTLDTTSQEVKDSAVTYGKHERDGRKRERRWCGIVIVFLYNLLVTFCHKYNFFYKIKNDLQTFFFSVLGKLF